MNQHTTEHILDPCEKADDHYTEVRKESISISNTKDKTPVRIVWTSVIMFVYLHLASLYAMYLMFTAARWQTNVFAAFLDIVSGIGVTAGIHRLWAHRSYKARLPLRIFLGFLCTIACQKDIYVWCRDHRVHHKYSETDADPHNAKRGFFFSHIGWLLCRKHPDVITMGKTIDLSDLMEDPVVRFQRKYYVPLATICCFLLPTVIPMYFWNETFLNALLIPTLFRLCASLNQAFLVNSVAHMWGNRPYDFTVTSRENALVVLGAIGEGFHNYHHTFPYDYATSEYGIKYNLTTAFIDLMAWLGLAYDLKTASRQSIKARKLRTGQESIKQLGSEESDSIKEK